ncbi:MAG TPA: DUF2779 domain-containing protein [Candidatus Eisenbacteria bacterium]|nr:DUF2779 domain-containing protein [Candidatus Eisenbacteria bacterium]
MDNASTERRLSKTRFLHGLQCHKQLWWRVHEPGALELIPNLEARARFEEGHEVGERARRALPGGVMIPGAYDDLTARVQATREALDAGRRRLYEAAFMANGTYVAVDILDREADAFVLIEVKATTRPRLHHLQDAAIQTWVLRQSGIPLERVEIMRLEPECVHPDLDRLFARDDVTQGVEELLPEIPAAVESQLKVLDGPLPDVAIGPHCTNPYPCPFMRRCWADVPPHHVTTLYRAGAVAFELAAKGLHTVADVSSVPEGIDLDPVALRQIRAVREGRIIVEPGLAEALTIFEPPLAYLDFETVSPAIPVWPGTHPFEAIPVQFSCRLERGGVFEEIGWLATEGEDPRREIASRLIDACRGARTIVAYHAEFEAEVIASLEDSVPERAAELRELRERLRDPLPILRQFVYHPAFHGRFGLKSVAPALAPDVRYTGAVAAGRLAGCLLSRLMLKGEPSDLFDRERIRESLRRYCALDTFATQRVIERLRELASATQDLVS